MWFNNLLIYRLTQDIDLCTDTLEAALASKPARPCATQELTTYGFIAPFGKGADAPLVHSSQGFVLIGARKEERILPGSVIRDALKEKVEQIEAEQLRKVYKKERDQLKEDIVQAFLPRAFTRKSATFAMLMPQQGLLLVDSSSTKRAEDLLSTLREALGSLPVRPVAVKIAPSATMTEWVKTQQTPEDFHVLDQALLRDTHEDGGSIAAKRQDMASDEIQLHLSGGKQVTNLALAWQDKLSFVLDDKLTIKRLKFEDLLQDQAEQDGGDDAMGQLDASFVLMALTFTQFLPALLEALGGEDIPQGLGEQSLANESRPTRERRPEVQAHLIDAIDATIGADEDDPLYSEAVRFVTESRRASISAVQRYLKIGYNRAARMIETMESAGIVTAMNTNGSREVISQP